MTPTQYLTDKQWAKIEPIITQKLDTRGSAFAHISRDFVNACLYILHTNCAWQNLPSEYGDYKVINRRYLRWRDLNIWDAILVVLLKEPNFEWLLIDDSKPTHEQQVPIFTMKFLKMISPSKPLLRQVQKQIADELAHLKQIDL